MAHNHSENHRAAHPPRRHHSEAAADVDETTALLSGTRQDDDEDVDSQPIAVENGGSNDHDDMESGERASFSTPAGLAPEEMASVFMNTKQASATRDRRDSYPDRRHRYQPPSLRSLSIASSSADNDDNDDVRTAFPSGRSWSPIPRRLSIGLPRDDDVQTLISGGCDNDGDLENGHTHDNNAAAAADSNSQPQGEGAGNQGEDVQTYLINTDRRRFWIVFLGVMLTYFIAIFDGTIMASSHPVITSYFNSSNSASWLSTAFLLTSIAYQPMVGRLSDAVGRKPLYVLGIVIFTLATLWCALAQSMISLIFARAFCGLGAGGMMGLGAIILNDLVPYGRRGPYQSVININYGIAAASGAAFGGLMADTLGWRWEFGIQLLPLAVCFTIATLSIPRNLGLQNKHQTLKQTLRKFDWGGSASLTTSTTFLILGLNLGGNVLPWSHPFVIASLVAFGVAFLATLWAESRTEKPIMPLALLHSVPRANLIFANFIAAFLLNAILFNAPLFFQAVLLRTPTESGLYLVIPTVTASIMGALTGLAHSYFGRLKWPVLTGTLCYLAATVVLSCMRPGWPLWAYLLCLVPGAMGQGLQYAGTTLAILGVVDQRDQAVTSSTLALWRSLGNVLGIAFSSLVLQNALLRYLIAKVRVPSSLEPPGSDGAAGQRWKAALIERVRGSVGAVAQLPDGPTKDQVVDSYESAVRVTFLFCIGVAAVSTLLILPIRLPRAKKE
ncbi:major facilitator superfamily domain-containing protein [Xylariomycetidae sp. FL2044]|nr:major facilitator superfamily domain-containing protein [Xylariomycetidae sp. FL2044]